MSVIGTMYEMVTSTYGHHLVNTIQRSVLQCLLGSDAGCCYSYCSNLFEIKSMVNTISETRNLWQSQACSPFGKTVSSPRE